jgi:hypothetical protein
MPPQSGEAAIRQLQTGCRRTGLAIFPDGPAVGQKQYSGSGLSSCGIDGSQDGAVHATERFQMSIAVEYGDDDRPSSRAFASAPSMIV